MNWCTLFGLIFISNIVVCVHDYYAGVFNRNDLLVAQDTLYKEKAYFRTVTTSYIRYFKCPISYYRVQDRLGVAQGPRIERLKGGLGQNFLLLRLTSVYNLPIAVNIYIACVNKIIGKNEPMYTTAPWTRAAITTTANGKTTVTAAGDSGPSTAASGTSKAGDTSVQSTAKAEEATTVEANTTGKVNNSVTDASNTTEATTVK